MADRLVPVERKLRTALCRGGFTGRDVLLVVAVSGGPDSVALLHALLRLRESARVALHVAHLNHNFRGEEAEEDARFVSRLAASLGLPSTVGRADPVAYQREAGLSSFEEAAREVRYSFLSRVAEETGAAAVVLGHTVDDHAETVLMHIIRGSGLHGLRGMEALSTWRDRRGSREAVLFRPLLEVTKAETAAYCQARGLAFRVDSGNLSPRFTRNRVRDHLLPVLRQYNPRIAEALQRLGHAASLEVSFVEGEVDRVWDSVVRMGRDEVVIDGEGLAALHPLVRLMVFRRAYERVAGHTRRLRQAHLTAMDALLASRPGKTVQLPAGLSLSRGYGALHLGAAAPESPCPFPPMEGEYRLLPPPPTGEASVDLPVWRVVYGLQPGGAQIQRRPFDASLDADSVAAGLLVRSRRAGDRFHPLGMRTDKKLQDFFVDQKVPREWRDRVPLLVSGGRIAWVVGYRVAEWAKTTPDSRSVLRVEFFTT
ncbi:MAG: tRNA lysidine(34) synthetase TilS [Dehalococcoidia bacterium]|nr:tRNA lysidine(34) synthetase TilS [Dehalococcoidia bacterium]